jgi:hypothetical protein
LNSSYSLSFVTSGGVWLMFFLLNLSRSTVASWLTSGLHHRLTHARARVGAAAHTRL